MRSEGLKVENHKTSPLHNSDISGHNLMKKNVFS